MGISEQLVNEAAERNTVSDVRKSNSKAATGTLFLKIPEFEERKMSNGTMTLPSIYLRPRSQSSPIENPFVSRRYKSNRRASTISWRAFMTVKGASAHRLSQQSDG
eukprot:292324_1